MLILQLGSVDVAHLDVLELSLCWRAWAPTNQNCSSRALSRVSTSLPETLENELLAEVLLSLAPEHSSLPRLSKPGWLLSRGGAETLSPLGILCPICTCFSFWLFHGHAEGTHGHLSDIWLASKSFRMKFMRIL